MSFKLSLGLLQALPRANPLPCMNVASVPYRPARFFTSLPSPPARISARRMPSSSPTFSHLRLIPQTRSAFPTSSVFQKTFSTSTFRSIRQTYFPRGSSNSSGGNGGASSTWRSFKRRIDRIPSMTVIYGIIGLNVAVFLLWQYAIQSFQRFRDPSLYQFLTNNFILNEANIMGGRLWTLLTACFSHSNGTHILMNCLGLYFVAPAAASLVGSAAFLGLYLGGGIFSSLTSLMWHRAMGDRWRGSEGASGAIYSCLAFYGALFPNTTFLLFFVVPMPAWALVGGIFAYDLYSAVFQPGSQTDSAGHVGGILAGVAAAYMVRRRGLGAVWRNGPRWR